MGLDTPAKSYKTVALSLKRASPPTGSVLPPTKVPFACKFKSNFIFRGGRERPGPWGLGLCWKAFSTSFAKQNVL